MRPPSDGDDPAATDPRYSIWDEPHRDYLYTEAWVRKLIREESAAYRTADEQAQPTAEDGA